jgi:menaquinone-9 beta-reductase
VTLNVPDLGAAARRVWDVVVIGAGPAGALAARQLALSGLAVLLVDRATFPRRKVCGCCLNAAAARTLNAVGLGDLLSSAHAGELRAARLGTRGRQADVPLAGWSSLSREVFDTALVEAARRAGAALRVGVQASLGDVAGGRRQVVLRQDMHTAVIEARLVAVATGLAGQIAGLADGLRGSARPGSRVGAGLVADDGPGWYESGRVYMACGTDGYVGLVRLEDGRLNLAAAFDPAYLRRAGGGGPAARGVLEEVGWPVTPALLEGWRGTPGLTRRPGRLAGERVFVLGDAAGYVEPFTGEGMAWALASAAALAPVVAEAVRRWRPGLAAVWARRHARLFRRRHAVCRAVAGVLRRPPVVRVVVAALTRMPGLAAPFVRHLNATRVMPR